MHSTIDPPHHRGVIHHNLFSSSGSTQYVGVCSLLNPNDTKATTKHGRSKIFV